MAKAEGIRASIHHKSISRQYFLKKLELQYNKLSAASGQLELQYK